MIDSRPLPGDDLFWQALHTEQAHLAITAPRAAKYRADVAPFAALLENDHASLAELAGLMLPGEKTHLLGERTFPAISELESGARFPVVRMIFPDGRRRAAPSHDIHIHPLTPEDGQAMVKLTDLAFPGYFRARTFEMGVYYGILDAGELIAMAGERVIVPGWREISGVCTHPAHTGNGYAARLITHLLQEHAARGAQSYLHVLPDNRRAIALYERLGFSLERVVQLTPVWRKSATK